MQVPQHRLPLRDYQKEIVQAFNDPKIDELLLVIARRGAKTTTTFSEGIVPDLVRRVQTAVAVYPTAKMGFRNFWNNIEDDGFKTLDHMPKPLVARQSNSEDDMRMELINGSIFMTLGATNTEALRGANGKNYWFDEFAVVGNLALAYRNDFTFNRFFLGSVGNDDGTFLDFLFFDALYDDSVVEGSKFHP